MPPILNLIVMRESVLVLLKACLYLANYKILIFFKKNILSLIYDFISISFIIIFISYITSYPKYFTLPKLSHRHDEMIMLIIIKLFKSLFF